MKDKADLLLEVRRLLADVYTHSANGHIPYARIARAHGYVDGYMKALIEMGAATKEELLEIVSSERERSSGPAMRPLADLVDVAAA